MATKLEVAKFLFGAAGQPSPGERAGTLAGGGNTTVRYGTVQTVDGTSVTILMEDTGETLYTMTTTPVAVGDRVAIIKNGQSVIVYATDQIVEMINKTVVDGDAEYAVGDDAYTAPKSGWSTTMPDVGQGEYLWMRYTTTLTDGTVKTSTPVCLTSVGGLVITSSEVSYAIGTSGTTPPSSGWQSTPPTAKPGQYLWSREVTGYSDGTSMTSYGVSYQGTNGQDGQDGAAGADGVGIEDSDVTWQKSSSGTTPPTGTWLQSPPDLEPGDYLWTRTVWTYTDGSSTTAYSVSKAGDTGPQGIQGPPGEDGEPRYTWIKYADSASGAGMSDDPDGKSYMGIAYNKQSPTESLTASDYAWSLIKGADGQQGIQGPPGEDGKPTYTWIKYADDDQGTGMTDNPEGKDYIGIAYNKGTPTESPTASDYAWSLIKGETGVGIDRVRDMYYLSTSSTQCIGGTWVYDECPEWQEGRYIWTRMEIKYDDESVHLTDPVLMSALNQANENAAKVTWHVWPDDEGLHITQEKNSVGSTTNMLLSGDSIHFRLGNKTLMRQYLDDDNNVVFDVMGWGGFRFTSSDAALNMTNTGFSYSAMNGSSFSSDNMHTVETAELELTGDRQHSTFSNVRIPKCTSLPDYMVVYYYDIFGHGHRSEKVPVPRNGTAQMMHLLGYSISAGNSSIVLICEAIEITVTGSHAPIYCSVTRGIAGPVRANITEVVGFNGQPGTQFYIEKINFCW